MMRPINAWLLAILISVPGVAGGTDSLYLLGKTWGYLKYHHPLVRQGCFDWDQELLVMIDNAGDSENEEEFQERLAEWISGLDQRATGCGGEASQDVHLPARNEWIENDNLLGARLSAALSGVRGGQAVSSPQYYVSQRAFVGNPLFDAEDDYADLEVIDDGFRLLALFRYWNAIEYWFPYRDLIERDWDDVLREFIPRLRQAEDRQQYVLELIQLVTQVQDGHANVWTARDLRPPVGERRVSAAVRVVEGQPVVWRGTGDADNPGALLFGDIILAVDGRPFADLVAEFRPFYESSNAVATMSRIADNMLRGTADTVLVTVDRGGERRDVIVERAGRPGRPSPHDRDGQTLQMLDGPIAYVKLSSAEDNAGTRYVEQALGAKGLIIDIRNYPSAFMVFSLGQHLVNEKTEFARFTKGDLDRPGQFNFTSPMELVPAEPYFDGPVVVLVDERSVSQSEYTAMAFRASPNAIVIGSQTAGADGNVSNIPLPGGHRAGFSGIGVFYPDKSPTQRIGIVPDIAVQPTIAGLRAGRDEVLEVAVRQILGDSISDEELRRITRIPHAPVLE